MRHLTSHSSFEGDIVKYYELFFYSGKEDYIKDVVLYICDYVGDIEGKRVIDVGCGTGVFDEYFVERGAEVAAIDISRDMIDYAQKEHKNSSIVYQIHDICRKPVTEKGDIVVALSHVIGYQIENDKLKLFLKNISGSLKNGGLFAFNFYNMPAILSKPLTPQFREVETNDIILTRISNAIPNLMKNTLKMQYRYLIEAEGKEAFDIKIEEEMRYYSFKELENYLYEAGFKIKSITDFLMHKELSGEDWNGFIVTEKVR